MATRVLSGPLLHERVSLFYVPLHFFSKIYRLSGAVSLFLPLQDDLKASINYPIQIDKRLHSPVPIVGVTR